MIQFQVHQLKPFPATLVPPGTPYSMTVNVGVSIPEVIEVYHDSGRYPHPPDIALCQAKSRLAVCTDPNTEDRNWIPLTHSAETCVKAIRGAWDDHGRSFLAAFGSREDFVRCFREGGKLPGHADTTSAWQIVILLVCLRRESDAREVIATETARFEGMRASEGYLKHLRRMFERAQQRVARTTELER